MKNNKPAIICAAVLLLVAGCICIMGLFKTCKLLVNIGAVGVVILVVLIITGAIIDFKNEYKDN